MNSSSNRSLVSIVTPVYNEAEGIARYFAELIAFMNARADTCLFEVILVDDGSTDESWSLIHAQTLADKRFRGLRLSRNFGAHIALTAGIDNAHGDAVVTLACDLQDPLSVVAQFIDRWNDGAEIVWAKRIAREDSAWRSLASNAFTWALRRYAMPKGSKFQTGSFFLIDRKVAEAFGQFGETHRITFALVAWTGFDQDIVEYKRERRQTGQSGWTLRRMVGAMYDAFLGFSSLPVRLVTMMAFAMSLFTGLLTVYVLVAYLTKNVLPGWTGIMLAQTGIASVTFLILSIYGEYLRRIYGESVGRPVYFVSRTANLEKPSSRSSAPASACHHEALDCPTTEGRR